MGHESSFRPEQQGKLAGSTRSLWPPTVPELLAAHRSERSSLCSARRRAFRVHYQSCGQPQEIDASGPQALGRFSFQAGCKWPAVARMRERCWRMRSNCADGSASRVNRPRAETGRNCSLALRAAGWVNNPRAKMGFRSERSSNMAGRRRSLGYEPVVGVVPVIGARPLGGGHGSLSAFSCRPFATMAHSSRTPSSSIESG